MRSAGRGAAYGAVSRRTAPSMSNAGQMCADYGTDPLIVAVVCRKHGRKPRPLCLQQNRIYRTYVHDFIPLPKRQYERKWRVAAYQARRIPRIILAENDGDQGAVLFHVRPSGINVISNNIHPQEIAVIVYAGFHVPFAPNYRVQSEVCLACYGLGGRIRKCSRPAGGRLGRPALPRPTPPRPSRCREPPGSPACTLELPRNEAPGWGW